MAIIGAGVAGLAAARALRDAGARVLVLEARSRIGGRVFTRRDHRSAIPIELGAEFLHGTAEETIAITREARLAVSEIIGSRWRVSGGHFTRGKRT